MSRKFQKCVESFVCINCGESVSGNGYTNHCPKCLWSRHVDINPGDRAAACGGAMEPVHAFLVHGELVIEHRCQKCGFTRRNKTLPNDNKELLYPLLNS